MNKLHKPQSQAKTRIVNRIIKASFTKHLKASGSKYLWTPAIYNDLRAFGRRRCAKSFVKNASIWPKVLEDLKEAGIDGWHLYEPAPNLGAPNDASSTQYGIKQYQSA